MRTVNTTGLCIYCGSVMLGRRADGVYCTAACRVKGNRILKREREAGGFIDCIEAAISEGILLGPVVAPGTVRRDKASSRNKKGKGVEYEEGR